MNVEKSIELSELSVEVTVHDLQPVYMYTAYAKRAPDMAQAKPLVGSSYRRVTHNLSVFVLR